MFEKVFSTVEVLFRWNLVVQVFQSFVLAYRYKHVLTCVTRKLSTDLKIWYVCCLPVHFEILLWLLPLIWFIASLVAVG